MDLPTIALITIAMALAFDVINGFHDAANSIATVVSTRVLSPRFAVLWAAFFNFVAYFIFHAGVANTISKWVKVSSGDAGWSYVVLAGLVGAIIWNLLTWWWGLPSSSSHALMGGLCGAGVAYGGWDVLQMDKISPTLYFILLAPFLGMALGSLMMVIVSWAFRRMRPSKIDRVFRVGQLASAALYSIGHGGNDAQKTAGIIVAVLVAAGAIGKGDDAPTWVILSSYAAMAFGTAIGGWRIVKTMGMGLTHLKPVGGFCAETAGAITLFLATHFKIPVSTTHTITGAIVGVGSTTNGGKIRWGLASRIVWAWVFTIPAAGIMGAGSVWLLRTVIGF